MGQSYETTGRTGVDFSAKQPHELLIQLGGALAVLLSVVLAAIRWSQGPVQGAELSTLTTTVLINVVLGGALFVASAVMRRNLMNGAIVAGVVSAILIVFGGQSGTIGGLVGMLGAVLGAASPYLPWSHRK